ncbi:hypothetical protein Halru_0751 [Halovivax ruber XH-70]|uniref:Uncharacterized protein n=1 Tax=Halovivax ruber (strain DSM 18193 / JCM 13892 / XH-70) TaxID=797302 RepID=L0I992_HALRX|nr:hypothetical protein [Halovivax ruber]AGB15378.1 hypothetical protein Halru_0751 [Halovivax ruber XH-70]
MTETAASDRLIDESDSPVDIELQGTSLRATDSAGNVFTCDLTGFSELSWTHSFEEPIDATLSGRVSELRCDLRNVIALERRDAPLRFVDRDEPIEGEHFDIGFEDDVTVRLPAGEYYCQYDCEIFARIRFDGEARIRNRSQGELSITFPHPTPLTIGFKSTVEVPRDRLTIEPTTTGLATAITNLSAALRTTGPSRVHRSHRGYPPLVGVGDETVVPESVRENRPETGLDLFVPDTIDAIYTAAPVAYFLGARVVPTSDRSPRLVAEAADFSYQIPTDPSLATGISTVLRRTFFLDLLVDWIQPDAPTLAEHTQLAEAGIDLEPCRDRSLADRVATYLDLPADPVDEILPGWPYRMTMAPDPSYAPALPHLCYDLAAIDTPQTSQGHGTSAPVESKPPQQALLDTQPLHGTVGSVDREADFEARLAAYENRIRSLERGTERRSIVVATGPSVDPALGAELAAAYTDREETVPTTVETLAQPTRDTLRRALTGGADFFHYVGTCTDGLGCLDGPLDPESLSEIDPTVVQLDGPGARSVADAFVTAGAVAVASRDRVHEGRAGSRLGTLLLYGQSVATAAQCSQLVDFDPTLSVVGDGAHRYVAKWKPTAIQTVSADAADSLEVTVVPFSVDPVGAHWRPDYDSRIHLMPAAYSYDVEASAYSQHFLHNNQPVLLDDGLYLPDEQRRLLYPIA